jgi:hypothetical protein
MGIALTRKASGIHVSFVPPAATHKQLNNESMTIWNAVHQFRHPVDTDLPKEIVYT